MTDLAVLEVHLHDRAIGTLTRLPDDRNFFAFNRDYIDDRERPTLSLSFKDTFGELITDSRPTQTRLPPFFANLLPEGALRTYLAKRARVKPSREFFLAWVLGRDLPGAVQIVPSGSSPLPLAERSDELQQDSAAEEAMLRFSLAGVQLKFSAVSGSSGGLTIPADGVGGSWIVKLPSTRFANVPENEIAMLDLARRVGIDVPETQLVPIRSIRGLPRGIETVGDTAFAIRRFDRTASGERIHIEDFAQVFGVYPEDKYERASYRNVAKVLWVEAGEPGVAEFLRRLVFNTLIGNADMHLKNWSLIYPDGRGARLSPAYDFVSTIAWLPDEKMALTFTDSKAFASVTREQFARFAAKAGLPQKLTLDVVAQTVTRFEQAWKDERETLGNNVRATIDAHLKTLPLWAEMTARKRPR